MARSMAMGRSHTHIVWMAAERGFTAVVRFAIRRIGGRSPWYEAPYLRGREGRAMLRRLTVDTDASQVKYFENSKVHGCLC